MKNTNELLSEWLKVCDEATHPRDLFFIATFSPPTVRRMVEALIHLRHEVCACMSESYKPTPMVSERLKDALLRSSAILTGEGESDG